MTTILNITPTGPVVFSTTHSGFEESSYLYDNWSYYDNVTPLGQLNKNLINKGAISLFGVIDTVTIEVIDLVRDIYNVYEGLETGLVDKYDFYISDTLNDDKLKLQFTFSANSNSIARGPTQIGPFNYFDITYQVQVKNYDYNNSTLIDSNLSFIFRIFPWVITQKTITIFGDRGSHDLKIDKIINFTRDGVAENKIECDKTLVYRKGTVFSPVERRVEIFAESYTYSTRTGFFTEPVATYYHNYVLLLTFLPLLSFDNGTIIIKIGNDIIASDTYAHTSTDNFTLNIEIDNVFTINFALTTEGITATESSIYESNKYAYTIKFDVNNTWYNDGFVTISINSGNQTITKTLTILPAPKPFNSSSSIPHNINFSLPNDGFIIFNAKFSFLYDDVTNSVTLTTGSENRIWETDPDTYQTSLYVNFEIYVRQNTVVRLSYNDIDISYINYTTNFTLKTVLFFEGFDLGKPQPKLKFNDRELVQNSSFTFEALENIKVNIETVDAWYNQTMKYSVYISDGLSTYVLLEDSPFKYTTNTSGIIPAAVFAGMSTQQVEFRVHANNTSIYFKFINVRITVERFPAFSKITLVNGEYMIKETTGSAGETVETLTKIYDIHPIDVNKNYLISRQEKGIKIYFTDITDVNIYAILTNEKGENSIVYSEGDIHTFYEINTNLFESSFVLSIVNRFAFTFKFRKYDNELHLTESIEYILNDGIEMYYHSNKNRIVFMATGGGLGDVYLIKNSELLNITDDIFEVNYNTFSYSSYFLTTGEKFILFHSSDASIIEFYFVFTTSEPKITSSLSKLENTLNFADTIWLGNGLEFKFKFALYTTSDVFQKKTINIDMNVQQTENNVTTYYKILDSSNNIVNYGLKVEKYDDCDKTIDNFLLSPTLSPSLSFITDNLSKVINTSLDTNVILQFTGHIVVDVDKVYTFTYDNTKILINDTEVTDTYTFDANIPYSIRIISKNNNPSFTINSINITSIVDPINIDSSNISFLYGNVTFDKLNISPTDLQLSLVSKTNESLLYQDGSNYTYLVGTNNIYITKPNSIFGLTPIVSITSSDSSSDTFSTLLSHDSNTTKIQINNVESASNEYNIMLQYQITKNGNVISIDFPFLLKLVNFNAFHTATIMQSGELHHKDSFIYLYVSGHSSITTQYKNTVIVAGDNVIYFEGSMIGIATKVDAHKITLSNLNTTTIYDTIRIKLPEGIDVTPQNKTLTFNMSNTIVGISSIIRTEEAEQKITSNDVTITLNVDLEALISCKIS